MSIRHTLACQVCRKGMRHYVTGETPDYPALREREARRSRPAVAPGSVTITETMLNGVPAEFLTCEENPTDRIILYFHGGSFVVGSPQTRRSFTGYLAAHAGYNVAAADYRLAPEHPFPAAPEDAFAAYRALLQDYAPENILLLGESAGGNLVLSVLLQIKAAQLSMPAAGICLSPCVQYDEVLPSYTENLETEYIVSDLTEEVYGSYLQSRDKEMVRHPLAAPYYGDFAGCAPIHLWASTAEILRDDSLIMFDKLKKAGHNCRLYLRDDMIHTWPIMPYYPEAIQDLQVLKTCMDDAFAGTLTREEEPIRLDNEPVQA
ncbi:MAG: alpha/beta hydrolase [Lachnospiraceae bacterium]|nr:alpha/beta hydrolase [Lachnospiraceae bacterium]